MLKEKRIQTTEHMDVEGDTRRAVLAMLNAAAKLCTSKLGQL